MDEDCPNWPQHLRRGCETLDFIIDLEGSRGEVARIRDWDGGAFELHTKCTDSCDVFLLCQDAAVAESRMDVPSLFPGNHYKEYLILDIAEDGRITNWNATAADFQEEFGGKETP